MTDYDEIIERAKEIYFNQRTQRWYTDDEEGQVVHDLVMALTELKP